MALGDGGDHGAAAPLIADHEKYAGGGGIVRSGSMWTASAHVITAVIGSGVLSLAWSIAQLGWVAGPAAMLVFAAVTALQSTLFADCYRSPDPEHGPHRNRTYAGAVDRNLGSSSSWVCWVLQHTALFGYGIAYTITASISCSESRNRGQPPSGRPTAAERPRSMAVRESLEVADGRRCEEDCDDDGHRPRRAGTAWTCAAHIITAVIGSGVLSLAWGVAQLGWVVGPACMFCFALVTYVSAALLAGCYRTGDREKGPRNPSYMDAVRAYLGKKHTWACGSLQYVSLYGCGVAYTITTATSIRAILKANCYHKHGHDAPCSYEGSYYMLVFGAVQLFLSFIPDFHDMAWLSVVAAVMSFSYAFIGLGLGMATTIANGTIKGSITGVPMRTPMQKIWRVSQAIGDIAFAYPYSLILLEIQDTLKSPPAENKTMKRASMISILVTTFFYLCCGCFGYAAFGSDAPGNLLTGFGFYEPYWLIDFANACIILHLLGGYQVYSQPIFQFADRFFAERFPDSGFVNDFHTVQLPCLPPWRVNLLRVCFRTVYVASTTAVAVAFPYFNEVLALLGALNFWPLAIYFPVEMYFIQRNVTRWSARWVVLQTFSVVCLLVSAFALVGSIEGLITQKLG